MKFKSRDLNTFEPACGEINNFYACEAHILIYDHTAWVLLYYLLVIWTYQVYMHLVPRFYSCNHIGWNIPINIVSIFELLKCLAHLNGQHRL